MKGTLLNTATVAVGGFLGWRLGASVPESYQATALSGLGLVTVGLAMRMFFQAKNILIVAAAIALGGLLGQFLGFQVGIESLSEWARVHLGGESGKFNEGVITTSILFCVGPMTLLGCIQDGLEGKSELLAVKSTMDGIVAFFFAAALGPGVLVTALVVLVVQGAITLSARALKRYADDEEILSDTTGTGGAMLLGIALGLLGLKHLPMANYAPALVLAPAFILGQRKFSKLRSNV